jgi:hypothetical protein
LSDNTYIQGFRSFSADAHIVRITLDKFPFRSLRLLKGDMENYLSIYGQVLDLGITRSNGCFMGLGYVRLDLSPLLEATSPQHKLRRVSNWCDDDVDDHQVLLQSEDMSDFCHLYQRSGHCRADCPEYKKFHKCRNCNKSGHVMRNCPRNNASAAELTSN